MDTLLWQPYLSGENARALCKEFKDYVNQSKLEPPLGKGNDAKGSIQSCANAACNDSEDANP